MTDRGAGSVWALVVTTVLLAATVGVLTWSSAVVARQRAQSAADLAALAAARAQVTGSGACVAAGRVARASDVRLAACAADGTTVTVVVEAEAWSGLLRRLDTAPARGRARAGAVS